MKIKFFLNPNSTPTIKKDVSVIICVKNGEATLNNILDDLKYQDYDGNIEFIIVDDNSNDKTSDIIYSYINVDKRFKYISSKIGAPSLSFKKRALDAGIKASKYDYLLFTDVGCRVSRKWAKCMINQYDASTNYIIGLSFVAQAKKLVSRFQKIDLFMLMISTLSSTKSNYPLASSGQNLSYKKDLFISMNGFSKISSLMMGDDSIFMQMCLKNKCINIDIANRQNSFVQSKKFFKWKDLLIQRIRWAGDGAIMWQYNKLFFMIMLVTFLTNIFYCIIPFIFYPSIFITLFLIKFLFEFIFYLLGSIKINKKIRIFDFMIWFFIQIPYIVLVGVFVPFSRYLGWRSNS